MLCAALILAGDPQGPSNSLTQALDEGPWLIVPIVIALPFIYLYTHFKEKRDDEERRARWVASAPEREAERRREEADARDAARRASRYEDMTQEERLAEIARLEAQLEES